jgi:protein-tyrosine phosphatase
MTPDQAALDRRVDFQAVFNARDLGGLPTVDGGTVRRGVVFRADGVHRLSGDDLDVARGLGLRTVIDLRTLGEVDRGRFPEDLGVRWHHLPILGEMWSERELVATDGAARFLRDRYLDMLVEGRDSIAQAIGLVADEGPTLFHCAAGKDRTGIMAAVLLGLVGVSHEDIALDYHLSAAAMTAFSAWVTATYPDAVDAMSQQPAEYMEAPAEAMHLVLERIDEQHGSMAGLAADLGIDDDVIARLRATLVG